MSNKMTLGNMFDVSPEDALMVRQIVKHRSITIAANSLSTGASTITQRLQNLEERLGIVLFKRRGKNGVDPIANPYVIYHLTSIASEHLNKQRTLTRLLNGVFNSCRCIVMPEDLQTLLSKEGLGILLERLLVVANTGVVEVASVIELRHKETVLGEGDRKDLIHIGRLKGHGDHYVFADGDTVGVLLSDNPYWKQVKDLILD